MLIKVNFTATIDLPDGITQDDLREYLIEEFGTSDMRVLNALAKRYVEIQAGEATLVQNLEVDYEFLESSKS